MGVLLFCLDKLMLRGFISACFFENSDVYRDAYLIFRLHTALIIVFRINLATGAVAGSAINAPQVRAEIPRFARRPGLRSPHAEPYHLQGAQVQHRCGAQRQSQWHQQQWWFQQVQRAGQEPAPSERQAGQRKYLIFSFFSLQFTCLLHMRVCLVIRSG